MRLIPFMLTLAACQGDPLEGVWVIDPITTDPRRADDLDRAVRGDPAARTRLDPGGEAAVAWSGTAEAAPHPLRGALFASGAALRRPVLTVSPDRAVVHGDDGDVPLRRDGPNLHDDVGGWQIRRDGEHLRLTPPEGDPLLLRRR